MESMKINLGASRNWEKDGWHVLDHKLANSEDMRISGDIARMDIADKTFGHVFLSHVLEHIPHIKMQDVLMEINRIMRPGGTIRLLVPDLEAVARAYVAGNEEFFREAAEEDENIRLDLGLGGQLMNFIVSPGQDTVLFDRNLENFIAGYGHLYSYDLDMMTRLLGSYGFGNVRRMGFGESDHIDFREPLHVVGFEPVWQTLNKDFYARNNLVHEYRDGSYDINFTVTGFDRDPLTSLIVEAEKQHDFVLTADSDANGPAAANYNNYGFSLLEVGEFREKLDVMLAVSRKMKEPGFPDKIRQLLKGE